jgi:hypothetical protein
MLLPVGLYALGVQMHFGLKDFYPPSARRCFESGDAA